MAGEPPRWSVSAHRTDDRTVVTVTGEVDIDTAAGLRVAVNDLVVDGRVHLVVDLAAVTFIDSAGLGVLVGVHRKCRGLGGSLAIVVAPDGAVARVLALTGLARVFTCHPTLDVALESRPR